ncbi:MAG: hypothetical protein ACTSSK_07740 [Candidatus Heimdallarchaeota archaeon]
MGKTARVNSLKKRSCKNEKEESNEPPSKDSSANKMTLSLTRNNLTGLFLSTKYKGIESGSKGNTTRKR